MRDKIVWTEPEQDRLYTTTAAIMKEKPKTKVFEAVKLAVLTLPDGRRRKLIQIANIPHYLRNRLIVNGLLPADWEKTMVRGGMKKVTEEDPNLALIAELQGQVKNQQEMLEQQKEELRTLRNAPKPKITLDDIRGFLVEVVGEALKQVRAGAPLPMPQTPIRHNPDPPTVQQQRTLPKVIVLGPIAHQRAELLAEFSEVLNLRILGSDELGRMEGTQTADAVVGWVRFMNHEVEGRIKSDNYIRVNTMLELKDTLTRLAVYGK